MKITDSSHKLHFVWSLDIYENDPWLTFSCINSQTVVGSVFFNFSGTYALSIRDEGMGGEAHIKHYRLQQTRDTKMYYISDQKHFHTVIDVIQYYKCKVLPYINLWLNISFHLTNHDRFPHVLLWQSAMSSHML